jgi:hypothetical protein
LDDAVIAGWRHPLLFLISATCGFAVQPWAETRELSGCAIEPSSCLIQSSWEIAQHPFPEIRPSDASFASHEGMDKSIFGRRFSVLENWSTGRTEIGLSVGNETGDQVLQEVVHGQSMENSNPATSAWLSTPPRRGLHAFARFEQVDHFSDAWQSTRRQALGNPDISSPWPDRRFAWFGENLPPFSLAGAGLGMSIDRTKATVSFLDGWIWQHLPSSGRLALWKIQQIDAMASYGSTVSLNHRRQSLDAETDPSDQVLSNGELTWNPLADSSMAVGTTYEFLDGAQATESVHRSIGAFLRLRVRRGRWSLSGWHHLEVRSHDVRDTLAWRDSTKQAMFAVSVAGGSTDRPDGIRPQRELAMPAGIGSRPLVDEQFLRLEGTSSLVMGPVVCEASLIPWLVAHPWSYPLDPATGWRTPVSLSGSVYGIKSRLAARMGSETRGFETSLRHESQSGSASDSVDLVPPRWAATTTGWIGNDLGLSVRASLSWATSWIVRTGSAQPSRRGSGPTGQAWLEQTLFDDRLRLSLAALDLFAPNIADLPDGGQRRTRILVSANWKL